LPKETKPKEDLAPSELTDGELKGVIVGDLKD
jgi:hypothetical protein